MGEIVVFIFMGLMIFFVLIKCDINSRRIRTLENESSMGKCKIHVGSLVEDIEEVTL